MKNKKIIFFGELPPRSIHGASISNAINIKMLESTFKITVIPEIYDIENHNSVSYKKLSFFLRSFLEFFKKILFNRYDIFYGVIYLSTIGIIKNILILFFFKIFNQNSKIILHFHRSDFPIFMKNNLNRKLFSLVNLLTNRFIILSNRQLSEISKNYISKYYVLNNTIEFEIFNNSICSQKYNLTFLSNFIYEKGVIHTIKSVIELNTKYNLPIKLNLYGSFSNNIIKEEIENLVLDLDYINVNSTVTGIDKMNIIANSDLIILPSFNEGMPLILLESMSLGIPIIITNVGYIEEALGRNYPLFCFAGDVNSISNSILKFYRNDSWEYLKKDLINKYNHNYSNKQHNIELLKIFNFEN